MNKFCYYTMGVEGEPVLCRDDTALRYLHAVTPACVVGAYGIGTVAVMTMFSSPMTHDGTVPAYCWETRLVNDHEGFCSRLGTCTGSREQAVAMHAGYVNSLLVETGQFLKERYADDIH